MKNKNYLVTSKGFVKGIIPDSKNYKMEVLYTDKVREAQPFSTKVAEIFMKNHDIEGFVWKPFAQEAIRDMYEVKKIHRYDFMQSEDVKDTIDEWQPVKLMMTSDTDVGFLMSGKLNSEEAMTFEEAKAEALKRNTEMLNELMEKINKLKGQ